MTILLTALLTLIMVGPLIYFFGECYGYYKGLDDLGYEFDGDGQIVKKEANRG